MAAVEPEGTVHWGTDQDTGVVFELEGIESGTESGTDARYTSAHRRACAISNSPGECQYKCRPQRRKSKLP